MTRLALDRPEDDRNRVGALAAAPTEAAAPVGLTAASRRRQMVARILVALVARHAEENATWPRNLVLERRIAEVRRAFGSALDDGREIERRFRQIAEKMTDDEREAFFHAFLASCGTVLRAAGNEMRKAFVESVRRGARQASGRRC